MSEQNGAVATSTFQDPDELQGEYEKVPVGPRSKPTVVVNDLHIKYKVFATGKSAGAKDQERRLLKRSPSMRRAREVHALKGVTFTAYEGDAIGVVGSNGSGKSTLMKAIAGLLPAAQGHVYSEGNPTMLGVNAAMMSELSGERNVILGGLALGMTLDEVKSKYRSIVEFSGLKEEFLELPMRTYSSGMGARLRFAIAASVSHNVLLVDEALTVGDKAFQRRSEERIRQLRTEAGTVFLVSHGLGAILKTCNRALWIEQGVLRMDGSAEEVVEAYSNSVS